MASARIPADPVQRVKPKKKPSKIGIPDALWQVGLGPKPSLPPTSDKPAAPPNPYGLDPRVAPYLTPQLDYLKSQEDQQRAALTQYTNAVLAQLQAMAPQVGSDYDTAIQQSQSLAQAGADSLKGANGNDAIQAILASAGAPESQRTQVATNLNNVFNGGAAALFGSQGVAPGQQLIGDKAASLAFANELPGINALAGTQALKNLLAQSSSARQQVLAQAPSIMGDLAKQDAAAAAAAADANYKNRYLDYLGKTAGARNAAASTKVVGSAQGGYYQVDTKTGKSTLLVPGTGPTPRPPRIVGSDAAGRYLLNDDGTKTLITPPIKKPPPKAKTATAGQVSSFVDSAYYGKQSKSGNVMLPAVDPKGNAIVVNGSPKYVPATTATGKLSYNAAYKRLVSVYKLKPMQAVTALSTRYRRGERGRPWLTLVERSALQKAGVKPTSYYDKKYKNGFLNAAQYAALQAAGIAPPAEAETVTAGSGFSRNALGPTYQPGQPATIYWIAP